LGCPGRKDKRNNKKSGLIPERLECDKESPLSYLRSGSFLTRWLRL